MSRPSNRKLAILAALQVAANEGVQGVTFESVAMLSGMTKSGVLYHFGSKDDMIDAVVDHIVDEWDARSLRHLNQAFDVSSRTDRVAAFICATIDQTVISAELSIFVDEIRNSRFQKKWGDMRSKWVGDLTTLSLSQQIALLAADGIWIDDASNHLPFPVHVRERIVETLLTMVSETDQIT